MNKYNFPFLICLVFGLFHGFSQADCSTALPVCTNADAAGGVVNGYGNDDFNGRDELGCLRLKNGSTTIEVNSYWFKVKLAESGEFGFNIIPNSTSEDWDFAVFGPNPTCGALGEPIACNFRANNEATGVGDDYPSGSNTEAYEPWMTVNAGDEYLIFVNQYDGDNAGFSIEWKGAVISNNPNPLDCSILVNLGPDRDFCMGDAGTVLNATTFGGSYSYIWYKENPSTGIFEVLTLETAPTLFVDSSGNYKVDVIDNSTLEVKSDDIVVTFHPVPIANMVSNLAACDANLDGVEAFNLEEQTPGVSSGQTNVKVTYHSSYIFALAGASPLVSPFTSGNATIWARIESIGSSKCYDVTSFDLIVTGALNVAAPVSLIECDDDADGSYIFDLESQTSKILNGETGVVTYYEDELNAIDSKGWIPNPDSYNSKTRTIWVRAEPSLRSDCATILSFEIEVLDFAVANQPINILQCDDNNDGYYQFDLKTLKDAEVLGSQAPENYEIYYFSTQADADNNVNVLANPYTNVTPYAVETIYARIQNSLVSYCFNTTSFTLQVFDSANPSIPSDIPNLEFCDDMSDGDDTNGFYEFNLRDREVEILNGQSQYVFDIDYFEDPQYLIQIPNPTTYTNKDVNEQTIYVRVTNNNPNNVDCYSDTSFNIKVNPLPNAMTSVFEFMQCDEDGKSDGITDFNLEEADTFIALGDLSLNITYHLSRIDAASGINIQDKYPFSNNTASVVYARVESSNGCYRIVQVNLIVSVTAFPPNYARELITCDDDGSIDGLHVFDLAETTSEIIAQFLPAQNLRVSFYRNSDDALSETNKINPDNAYLSEVPNNQTIWVRAESSVNGGCFGVAPVIELIVNPIPEFELDEEGVVCLNNAPLIVPTYNPKGFYMYEWYNEAGDLISQQPYAEINNAGVYTVIASTNLNCESFPKQITITESNIAAISSEDVVILDNSNNNSITIITENENLGIGDYEFALDDISGPFQDSPTFSNIEPGQHTLYVQEKNNCGITSTTVYIFGFPNFFTPNGDGVNDTWNVRGVDFSLFPESNLYIYDRYGKLLANFTANSKGWDGIYNGHESLNADYWYLAQITDNNGVMREFKGHFSLIRRYVN